MGILMVAFGYLFAGAFTSGAYAWLAESQAKPYPLVVAIWIAVLWPITLAMMLGGFVASALK